MKMEMPSRLLLVFACCSLVQTVSAQLPRLSIVRSNGASLLRTILPTNVLVQVERSSNLTNWTRTQFVFAESLTNEFIIPDTGSAVFFRFSYRPNLSLITAINSGGPAAGRFSADTLFTGGTSVCYSNPINTSGVVNPAPAEVYRCERWGDCSWVIPGLVPSEIYVIRLHFAEIYFAQPGARRFNVSLQNEQVLSDFDIFAAAGTSNKAVVRTFATLASTNGSLRIAFTNGSADEAKCSGIEVYSAQGQTQTINSITIQPGREFAATSFVHRVLATNAAIDPNSANMVTNLVEQVNEGGTWVNTTHYSPPVYVVPANQPTVRVSATDPNSAFLLQPKINAVPLPDNFQSAGGTDKEAVIYQPSTGKLWEFWIMEKTGEQVTNSIGTIVDEWGARWGGRIDDIATNPGTFPTEGGEWYTTTGAKFGVTASSVSLLAGVMTIEEQERGEINHVVGIALIRTRAGVWSYPAHRRDRPTAGNTTTNPNALPSGAILRLPPATQLNLDTLPMDPYARMIARAVQKYGMVVWDTTSDNVSFRGEFHGDRYSENPYTKEGGIFRCPGGVNGFSCYPDQNNRLRGFPWGLLQVLQLQLNTEQ